MGKVTPEQIDALKTKVRAGLKKKEMPAILGAVKALGIKLDKKYASMNAGLLRMNLSNKIVNEVVDRIVKQGQGQKTVLTSIGI